MKEKIKEHLFIISIIYGITIIILMLITYSKMTTYIEINNNKNFTSKIDKYKQEISLLENNQCKNEITNLINFIEKTNYNKIINLKDHYNKIFYNNESILEYYSKIKNACSITDKKAKEYNLPTMFITASIQNDELIQRYLYQYEINIKDIYFRNISEPNLNNIENNIKKENELIIIKNILQIIKENNNMEVKNEN